MENIAIKEILERMKNIIDLYECEDISTSEFLNGLPIDDFIEIKNNHNIRNHKS